LSWIRSSNYFIYKNPDWLKLEIDALEAAGEPGKALEKRIRLFEWSPDADVYEEILNYYSPESQKEIKEKLIKCAVDHPDVGGVVHFLADIDAPEECSGFIEKNESKIKDLDSFDLRPVAVKLSDNYPLGALLLYRMSIKETLEDGYALRYKITAKDLLLCEELSRQVTDFKKKPTHEQYYNMLREKYQKRTSFWENFKAEKEAQEKKTKKKTS
jgi:hypothetical protein